MTSTEEIITTTLAELDLHWDEHTAGWWACHLETTLRLVLIEIRES